MISVAVIEDLEDYRNGLASLINFTNGYQCTGAYVTAEEAIKYLPGSIPDVALIDIGLPGKNGIELVEYIHKNLPSILCMMCTAYDEDEKVFKALEAGAHGYILKSTSPAKILEAINELIKGGSPMSNEIARKVVIAFSKNQNPELAQLTSRETEILALLAKGLLYKEIAALLSISIETVKRHCFNIYQKLHVGNRSEAIMKYHSNHRFQ